MAGNLVKWWKHKILGGYKQFSVQECTTDSEELMYHQVRASSSCSAPPDLLLVSDRENNMPLATEATNIIGVAATPPSTGATACPVISAGNNNQKLLHQHQQLKPQQAHAASYYSSSKEAVGRHQKVVGSRQVQPDLQQQMLENEGHVEAPQNFSSTTRHAQHHQQRSEEHIRLEEFTCDVSVEGGKSSQPLQFSFTFYDLDGHHGKITKDDIVGIVYTIYESIGKSVVVPHSGSKTINVRLTVSPEGKSKTAKAKKQPNVATQKDAAHASARRLHRYRPRKLIKSDEEDDDSNSDKEREEIITTTHVNNGHNILNKTSRSNRVNKTKTDLLCCQQPQVPTGVDVNNPERQYEPLQTEGLTETCRECLAAVEETRKAVISPTHNYPATATQFHGKSMTNEAYLKNVASTRMKILRKSRKQKHQDCSEVRQRSLSVGNETCWNNRHLQKSSHQHQQQWTAVDQQLNNTDVLDGVQLRSSLRAGKLQMSQKRNSAECWKTALNRNDLISIIRESMEKNRLCFQLNGKPQANVSPIRQSPHQQHQLQSRQAQQHRQRSNTGSKIPMLIANHNHRSNSFTNNNDTSQNDYQNSSSNIYHLQPHVPIYHQQIPINPAVVATQTSGNAGSSAAGSVAGHHSKMNLCGYDSFLHATICGGGLSHSPPPHTSSNSQPGATVNAHHSNQQIATVQPIMSSLTANSQSATKHTGISMTPNQIRTCKILRSGSYSQTQQTAFASTQNSPQYHGYQRLSSNNKQNLSTLNLERTQTDMSGKWRKEHVKNYDQLLYAKLTEKLQQTNLATTNKENVQRKRHRVLRHRRASTTVAQANKMCIPPVSTSKTIEYSTLIPVDGDPAECENLIVQTSDDESHSHHDLVVKEAMDLNIDPSSRRHVAEGTLVDLDDVCKHDPVDTVQHVVSKDILGLPTDTNDDLGIDGELDEDLADLEEIGVAESGRNSVASIEENEDIVANANGANTSATSSLIHRYVHEHIHHHYHHFEDKDE